MGKWAWFAWIVAVVAMAGSLVFSEVMKFVPCSLCWYQRIAMYPLVLILGIGVFYEDKRARLYALPLAFIGWLIALYHIIEQNIPAASQFSVCTSGVPCSAKYINWLGFISIPVLSFTAFTLIIVGLLLARRSAK
ncbi:disulfide oxidoreductase [Aureibacillus halotolerans]|uniref:Probable disulfide formation protein n=1 Tax=Aureibacillus halotolerans TaxID=1508390 RepID=A0A4R6TX16_9BACI|nr:disulfide oxidoreductase [Aureibacillus halotolerans]TDQ36395.1 disulfide bond formation protein DsbB [Aureibacillus halotolerans]